MMAVLMMRSASATPADGDGAALPGVQVLARSRRSRAGAPVSVMAAPLLLTCRSVMSLGDDVGDDHAVGGPVAQGQRVGDR